MFFIPELLTRRGQLAVVWIAATQKKEIFMQHYNKKYITEIDLLRICDEIEKHMNPHETNVNRRFSLYLASQLVFGTLRISHYQFNILHEGNKKILLGLYTVHDEPNRVHITLQLRDDDFDNVIRPIEIVPDIPIEIPILSPGQSKHCTLEDPVFEPFEESPSGFGPVPDNLLLEFLEHFRRMPYLEGAVQEKLSLPTQNSPFNIEAVDNDFPSQPTPPHNSPEDALEIPNYPQEDITRRSSAVQDPAKRQKIVDVDFQEELEFENNNPQNDEQIPPENELPTNLESEETPASVTLPDEPSIDEPIIPPPRRGKKNVFRDEVTKIDSDKMRKNINDNLTRTRPRIDIIDVGRMHMDANDLMNKFSTLRHFGIEHRFARNITSLFPKNISNQQEQRVDRRIRRPVADKDDMINSLPSFLLNSSQALTIPTTSNSVAEDPIEPPNVTNDIIPPLPHEGAIENVDLPVDDSNSTYILPTETPHQQTDPSPENSNGNPDFLPPNSSNRSENSKRSQTPQSSVASSFSELQITVQEVEAQIAREYDKAKRNGIQMPLKFTHIFPYKKTTKTDAANAFFHILGIASKKSSEYHLQQEMGTSLELFITNEEDFSE